MTDLKFALWDAFPESEVDGGSSIAEVYDRHIGLAQLVEQLGYHSYFVIEHQNRELISSPSVYLTGRGHADQRTSRGRHDLAVALSPPAAAC